MTKHLRTLTILLLVSLFVFAFASCNKKTKKLGGKESEATLHTVKISRGIPGIKDSEKKVKTGTLVTFDSTHEKDNNYLYIPKESHRPGYSFKGWFNRKNSKEVTEGYKIEEPAEIYGRYDPARFELDFDLNDPDNLAEVSNKKHTVYFGSGENSTIKTPTPRTGKETELADNYGRFLYYYIINKDTNEEIRVSSVAEKDAKEVKGVKWTFLNVKDNKIYAKWRKNEVDITLTLTDKNEPHGITPKTVTIKKYDILDWNNPPSGIDSFKEIGNKYIKSWYYERNDADKTKVTYNFTNDSVTGDMLTESTTLYAEYSELREIGSEGDYRNLIDEIKTTMNGADETKKKALQNAIIRFNADITLMSATETLFSNAQYPFLGRIEGNDKTITYGTSASMQGFKLGNTKKTIYSLVGYNSGHIEKLKVRNVILTPMPGTEEIYVGLIAYENHGIIEHCEVTTTGFDLDAPKGVYFGGIAYISSNQIIDTQGNYKNSKSAISHSKVDISFNKIRSEKVVFGGLVGVNNGSEVIKSESKTIVENIELVKGDIIFGGLIGENLGKVETCKCETKVTVNSANTRLNTNDTFIGGLIGKNLGYVKNIECSTTFKIDNSVGFYAGGLFGLHSGDATDIDLELDIKDINSTEDIKFGNIAYEIFRENSSKYTSSVSSVYMHGKINIKLHENATKLRFTYLAAKHDRVPDHDNYAKASFRKFLIDLDVNLESKKGGEDNLSRLEVSINSYEKFKSTNDIGELTFVNKKDGDKFTIFTLNGNKYSVEKENGADLKDLKIGDKPIISVDEPTKHSLVFQENKDKTAIKSNPLNKDSWNIKEYYGTEADHPSLTSAEDKAKIGVPKLKAFA